MTLDRGDNLGPSDALAVALSERAVTKRGVDLNDPLAHEYASRSLLSLEEAVAIVQGLAPQLHGATLGTQYLVEHEREVKRLLRDAAAGVLAMPCSPTELAQWARAVGVVLPSAFGVKLQPLDARPSPPPPKLRPDQQDRIDCQNIATEIWKRKPSLTIEKMLSERAVASYANLYSRDTVRRWVSAVDPRPPEHKRGPRRKSGQDRQRNALL